MSASIAATAERLTGMRRPPLLSVYSKVVTDVGATVLTREVVHPSCCPLVCASVTPRIVEAPPVEFVIRLPEIGRASCRARAYVPRGAGARERRACAVPAAE